MYYLEYKTSRRTVNYDDFMLREIPKDDIFLDFKAGSNNMSIAIEFQIQYQADESKRGNGGNALKIYANQSSDNAVAN